MRKTSKAMTWEALEARCLLSLGLPALTETTASLPTGRYQIAATSVGDKALFAGGQVTGGFQTNSNELDIYDASTAQWTQETLADGGTGNAVAVGDRAVFTFGRGADIYEATSGQVSTVTATDGQSFPLPAGAKAVYLGNTESTAVVYDGESGSFTTEALPVPVPNPAPGASAGTMAFFECYGSPLTRDFLDVYDSISNRWSSFRWTGDQLLGSAGTTVLTAGQTDYSLLNTITGRVAAAALPAGLQPFAKATTLGSKIITLANNTADSTQGIAVFDADSNTWSYQAMPDYRNDMAATSAGSVALLAGGDPQYEVASNAVDLFTDESTAVELSGGVAARARGKSTVVLQNSGDADFAGPYTVQIYAIPPRQYHNAVLVGSQAVNSTLAAGETQHFSIPNNLANAPAGTYPLVAMVKAADGTLTPFAGATQNFTVGQSPSATPAVKSPAQIRPALTPDSTTQPGASDPWLTDSASILT